MTVKSLLVRIGTDIAAMEAGFKKADALIQKNSDKFKTAGKTMTVAGGAILGVVTGVAKVFADFDQAMTESTAIMGDVSDAMRNKMAEAAKQMSEESTFAAKELAQSYFFLASAGLDAEQSIAALPVVTKFAQAGAFDLARATDLLTDAQSALGLSSKNVAENQGNMIRISDVLVAANTLANASVAQFSEALTNRAGPAMRAYDIELEEGVAVLAAFADQGVKGSMAGEQFSIVLRDLQKAAIDNKTAFKRAGIAVFDANGNLNNMGEIVAQLETRLGGMSAEQKKAELGMLGFQERSQMALLTLVGTSEKIKEYEGNLRSAKGVTEEVAEKQLKSLTNQMKLAKNAIVNTAISLGEQLAPMVVELTDKIKKTVKKIQDWIKEHPELTRQIATTALKAGILLTVLGPITMMLPGLVAGISALGKASVISSVGLGRLGAMAIVVYGAYKGLITIRDKWEKSRGKFTEEETKRWAELNRELGGWTGFVEKAASGLKKIGGEATIQGEKVEDLNDIWHLYGENTQETLKAIAEGKHGEDLKKLLKDIGSKHLEAAADAEEQGMSLENLKTNAENFMKTLENNLSLPGKLAEEFGTVVEVLETELYPGMRKLGPVTYEVVTKAGEYIRGLKEEVINLANTFPEKLEPSVLNTFEIIKNAQADLRIHTRKITKGIEDEWKETFNRIAEWTYFFINGIAACFSQYFTNVMIEIDNQEKRWLEAIDNQYDATIAANEALVESEREKTERKMDELDAWYEAEKQEIMDNIKDEDERKKALERLDKKLARKRERLLERREKKEQETADALEAIEKEKNEALRLASEALEAKRTEARRTAAKQEKAVALLNAIVNTAAAITKALPNIPLAIAVGILGGIQIALIKAQPIPLAEGGVVMKPTRALIGERGPEAVIPLNKFQSSLVPAPIAYKQNIYFYGNISNVGSMDEISDRLAEKTRRAIERGLK